MSVGISLDRSLGQFFFEVGYAACFAEVMIKQDMKAPFVLSDAHIEGAWPQSIEAHDDPAEIDRYLAMANAAPDLLAAAIAWEKAEDARNDCDGEDGCDNEGPWEHCPFCSERFGEAIDMRRSAIAIALGEGSLS